MSKQSRERLLYLPWWEANFFFYTLWSNCTHWFLAISGQCHIERDSSSAVGTPTFEGRSQTTYSCVANENCDYDVYVISNYEGNGHTGFRIHNTGTTNVQLSVGGQSSKPLVLVFVSYEPVNGILNIPRRVTIDKVLLVGNLWLIIIVCLC